MRLAVSISDGLDQNLTLRAILQGKNVPKLKENGTDATHCIKSYGITKISIKSLSFTKKSSFFGG